MSKVENQARNDIEAMMAGYEKLGYVSDRQIATALYLAQKLEKPLLVEGPVSAKPNWPRLRLNISASI